MDFHTQKQGIVVSFLWIFALPIFSPLHSISIIYIWFTRLSIFSLLSSIPFELLINILWYLSTCALFRSNTYWHLFVGQHFPSPKQPHPADRHGLKFKTFSMFLLSSKKFTHGAFPLLWWGFLPCITFCSLVWVSFADPSEFAASSLNSFQMKKKHFPAYIAVEQLHLRLGYALLGQSDEVYCFDP